MSLKRTLLATAALALAIAGPALAQPVVNAGDTGLATTGGGTTTLDLAQYPIQQIFGAPVNGDPVVSLVGESLGAGSALAGIDTIVNLPSNIAIGSGGTGSGVLRLVALRLVSESPVSIGTGSYDLRLFISEFSGTVAPGTVTFTFANGDGGTFNSTFWVRPRLVFTNRSTHVSTVIDCGAVTCGTGKDIEIRATNVPFAISGGPGKFLPSSKQIKLLGAGVQVDGDGNGVAELTTRGSSNFFVGVAASTGFPLSGFNKYEFPVVTRPTSHYPTLPIPDAVAVVRPFPRAFASFP
jgi:hypothetical protein